MPNGAADGEIPVVRPNRAVRDDGDVPVGRYFLTVKPAVTFSPDSLPTSTTR